MSATLQFPQLLEIRVTDATTQRLVSSVGLMLTIFASRKNNYHLALVTDSEGKARVSEADIRESMRTDQELFPMDYASSLEECAAEIEVKVCSAEEVKKAIAAMDMFKSVTKIDDNLIRGFKTSRNTEYVPTVQRVSLDQPEAHTTLEVMIQRATAVASSDKRQS